MDWCPVFKYVFHDVNCRFWAFDYIYTIDIVIRLRWQKFTFFRYTFTVSSFFHAYLFFHHINLYAIGMHGQVTNGFSDVQAASG